MSAKSWRVQISARAHADLRQIVEWSHEQFGPAQASRYREIILAAIRELHEDPERLGVRNRDDIIPGLRAFHVARHGQRGRHLILFRVAHEERVVGIVRLLHDAMDLARHIPSDSD